MTTKRLGARNSLLHAAVFAVLLLTAVMSLSAGVAEGADGEFSEGAAPLRIVYFNSPTCHDCLEVKTALPGILANWGSRVTLEKREIDDIASFTDLLKFEKHYGVEVPAPPAVFVGTKSLIGPKKIINGLNDCIADELSSGARTFVPLKQAEKAPGSSDTEVPPEVLERFASFSVGAVAVAGLVDGVNPCAFTTIVFFLSMLAYLKKSRREVLSVGIAFTVGVFVAYFLLRLGLLGAVKSFSVSKGLSLALAYGVGGLAFALAGWSIWDYIQYKRTGDTKSITLALPKSIKRRIHKVIRTGLTTRGLVGGVLGVGFLVALLESLCTGQVYLPTIVFVTRAPSLKSSAVGYLIFYNIAFIAPLVVILAIAYRGVTSETLGKYLRRHLGIVKLSMAALSFVLGVLLVVTV